MNNCLYYQINSILLFIKLSHIRIIKYLSLYIDYIYINCLIIIFLSIMIKIFYSFITINFLLKIIIFTSSGKSIKIVEDKKLLIYIFLKINRKH